MRLVSLVLALGLLSPSRGRARAFVPQRPDPLRSPPPEKQSRRRSERAPAAFGRLRSPCGRHTVTIDGGAVFVDGRRVHPAAGTVEVLRPPTWRRDGGALAWLERGGGETRLVVLPELARSAQPLAWTLPHALGHERVYWAGPSRVVVGPEELQPHAVASWVD